MTAAPAQQPRFRHGDEVVLRYITRDGRPGMSWPFRVVEDGSDLVALQIPVGTTYLRWQRAPVPGESLPALRPEVRARRRSGREAAKGEQSSVGGEVGWGRSEASWKANWRREVLRLMFPERNHSVWLFWSRGDGERRFAGYYVNFEEPFRRTAIGFDTNDHMLDIVVSPELEWHWKDKEAFEERVRSGTYTAALADLVWKESVRVIAAIEGGLPPFSDGWERWRPDRLWVAPALPDHWQQEPVAQWTLRREAYGDAGP